MSSTTAAGRSGGSPTRDDTLVGRAGFGAHEDGRGRELGYTLRRDLWGRGLATEVAAGLVGWHRSNSDTELWALAAIENVASRRVLEKVGFGYIGDADHNDTPCALYRLGAYRVVRQGALDVLEQDRQGQGSHLPNRDRYVEALSFGGPARASAMQSLP